MTTFITKAFWSIVIIKVCLMYSVVVQASAIDDYNNGVEFYKRGEYLSAIASFKSAEKNGMESASLYYNLGSAYFKIKQYPASKYYYTLVKQYSDKRALAEFNLGMIALEQNENEEALTHFRYAESNSSDNRIADAAKQTIASLTGTVKRWSAYAAASFGYDDNINVTPDNVALGLDDTFYNVYASTDLLILGKRKNGWLLNAALFTLDYSDSDNFDQDFYTVGLRNEHQVSSWNTITQLKYGKSYFGGDDFQRFYKLDILGVRPLPGNARIILQYRFDELFSENSIYDYLEGWRQRAQIRYSRNTTSSNLQIYYEGELNNGGELVTSLYNYEYSPTRHTLGTRYSHNYSEKWHLTGDLAYRTSDFPASSTLDRHDTRWTIDLLLEYRIDPTFVLKSDVKYIQNDSSVDIYTYDKTVITLGASKLF